MIHPLNLSLRVSALLLSLGLATTACTHDGNDPGVQYAPEMYESIPYEPLRQTAFNTVNAFGINERTPANGTIPRGKLNYFDHIPKDSVRIAERVLHNPFAYTKANLEEGKVLYTRICSHCHGEQGNGQGPVGIIYKGVPNYSTGYYKTMNDGHIFHVIQWGRNRMMPHGSQVNPEERWKIAMYVHVLQTGEGPDALSKLIAKGPTSTANDSTEMTDRTNQAPVGQAQSGTGSETPGQGKTKATNGTTNSRTLAPLTHQDTATAEQLVVTDGTRKIFLAIIVTGVVVLILGVLSQIMGWGAPEHSEAAGHVAAAHGAAHEEGHSVLIKRVLVSLWHSNLFFLGVSTVGTVFMAINYVAYAGWSVMIKRIAEALSAWVIPGGVIMLVVFLVGRHDIFHWTHEGIMEKGNPNYDAIIAGKSGFLNLPFYVIRMVSYLVIWAAFSWKLRQLSLQEDLNGGTFWFHKSITASALFLVLYAVTSSMAAWDWVMSVDTHWFSTMFGWYVFASWWVSGIAAIALTAIFLKQAGYLRTLNASHIHDLGKLMFGFSIFWTYVWFAQFMLIWYANLPEEAVYFNQRLGGFEGRYTFLFFFNIAINFVFPFLGLMTRDAKRQMIIMKIVAIAILCGHWSDFYLMLMPGTLRGDNGFLIEIGIAAIFLGAFLILFTRRLASASLVPVNHPFLDESIHHTT